MRWFRYILFFLLLIPVLFSCNKELKVDADWKDITVVYGLLDQSEDTTFIKITKAFLGPGDAMQFSKIPDSSNYPDTLDVRLDKYDGTTLLTSYPCDTITIHNKKKGDSVFYYPDQLMYYTLAALDQDFSYKLIIINKKTGKEISAQTELVHDFEITRPQVTASFVPGQMFEVRWSPAKNGMRYQLMVRFYYVETLVSDPQNKQMKSLDWIVFNNVKTLDAQSTLPFDLYLSGDGFYSIVGASIKTDPSVTRYAHHCDFVFSVAASALNTYMEVTEPSMSIVQEKPAFTNIVNGIGLFSARFMKSQDSLGISKVTRDSLKINNHTKNLGF